MHSVIYLFSIHFLHFICRMIFFTYKLSTHMVKIQTKNTNGIVFLKPSEQKSKFRMEDSLDR